jgi:hypothetical protein
MAGTAEIRDPALRETLEQAERLIDADGFREAVELCADAYLSVMQRHSELAPQAPSGHGDGLGPPGGAAGIGGPTTAWPVNVGLQVTFDESGRPRKRYERERFNFSEAATCFEFTLDLVLRTERTLEEKRS